MSCCGNSKIGKYVWITIGLILFAAVIFSFSSCSGKDTGSADAGENNDAIAEKGIAYYTCGMHPSVKVTPDEYAGGNVNCPICNMRLVPVYENEKEEVSYYGCGMEGEEHVFLIQEIEGITKCPVCGMPLKKLSREEADRLRGVVSKVRIEGEQARLAGVKTEPAEMLHLYKTIRTVGRIAYDPQLAVAQEEFISSLEALDKIRQGQIPEIEKRARELVDSSKRKLKLLGLSYEQIKELEDSRVIHESLVLPEKKMWVYGDVYEYEMRWVKQGAKIEVTTDALPGEKFTAVISSISPVLDPKTRSVRFRAEVDNPDLKLKPEMYADVVIQSMYRGPGGEHEVLAVPKEAVLDTGTRKIIWVDKGNGEYEGRMVEVGPEAKAMNRGESKFYPVLGGLEPGELVVSKANFLIDSQSQITGVTATSYGGAIGEDEESSAPPIHQH